MSALDQKDLNIYVRNGKVFELMRTGFWCFGDYVVSPYSTVH